MNWSCCSRYSSTQENTLKGRSINGNTPKSQCSQRFEANATWISKALLGEIDKLITKKVPSLTYMKVRQKDIVAHFYSIGIEIESVYDFRYVKHLGKDIIQYLVELVDKDFESLRVKESVIRTLARKEAKGLANKALIKEFLNANNEEDGYKWAIGNAIEVVIQPSDFDELREIVLDQRHGTSRQMIVLGMAKLKSEKTEDLLLALLGDKAVEGHALSALYKLKSKRAAEIVKTLPANASPLARKYATKLAELKQ